MSNYYEQKDQGKGSPKTKGLMFWVFVIATAATLIALVVAFSIQQATRPI